MDFERFDICEAYFLIACAWGEYAMITRLKNMGFKPSPLLRYDTLTENGQMIYDAADERLQAKYYPAEVK